MALLTSVGARPYVAEVHQWKSNSFRHPTCSVAFERLQVGRPTLWSTTEYRWSTLDCQVATSEGFPRWRYCWARSQRYLISSTEACRLSDLSYGCHPGSSKMHSTHVALGTQQRRQIALEAIFICAMNIIWSLKQLHSAPLRRQENASRHCPGEIDIIGLKHMHKRRPKNESMLDIVRTNYGPG